MTIANRHRPTVMVTGPDKLFKPAWWATRLQLWRVGVKAIYLSPKLDAIPSDIDGVIIGGGSDIQPINYGEEIKAGTVYDPKRDTLELDVIKFTLAANLPLLGICRGAQLINVARGGTLYADLRTLRKHTPNTSNIFTFKEAMVEMTSMLGQIYKKNCVRVNSLHNQAVKKLGDNLIAVAHDKDGFIQAIEDPKQKFLLGVQWHPEYLMLNWTQSKLFSAFATATIESREHRSSSKNLNDLRVHLNL